jgi:ribosomal protein S2
MKKIARNIISTCGHIGTHKYNWQPESERFAIGYRSSILIYNVAISSFYINRALFFVENLVSKYGRIYVYGLNRKNDKKFIKKLSSLSQVVTTQPWCGGYVTNARVFRDKIKNLKKRFSAILGLNYDYQNYSLPREAKIINLPCAGVVDSNSIAENFSYPIPINSSSFGSTRLMAYKFAVKIFKGLSKRILTRFKKKVKVTAIKSKYKKRFLLKKYFKSIKKKLRRKKNKIKLRLKRWSRKYNERVIAFKKRAITATKRKARRDYIRKDNQDWLTFDAALRRQTEIEKIRKLPKQKIRKFIKRKLIARSRQLRASSKVKKRNDRKLFEARREKLFPDKKAKSNSFMRIKSKKKRLLKIRRKIAIKVKGQIVKKVAKRAKKRKNNRFRPNKKWKKLHQPFKPRRRVNFKKIRFVSTFSKIKKKLRKLSKLKSFRNLAAQAQYAKNPKFVYRILKKTIHAYKLKKIYKYLYKKKKKLLVSRKRRKNKKQRGMGKKKQYLSAAYNVIPPKLNKGDNNYAKHYNNRPYGDKRWQNNKNAKWSGERGNLQNNAKDPKKHRYYYKDYGYHQKPKKKKFYF